MHATSATDHLPSVQKVHPLASGSDMEGRSIFLSIALAFIPANFTRLLMEENRLSGML